MTSLSLHPQVSVVIPSYNHARYLPACIQSVLSQRDVSLELVIVDDGSKDDSWLIIQQAAALDDRIRPFRQHNQGAHAAINAGLAQCRGDFLAILNSDDLFHADRLATLLQLAEQQGLDFISTGLRLIDAQSNVLTQHPWQLEYERMEYAAQQHGVWAALLERNVTVSTSNFFMRRALFETLGPIRPLRYTMDWDYALRACCINPDKFAWRYDLQLLDYRLHGSNTILGGLPVSAIEANHLVLRSIRQVYGVPGSALAGVRRHYKLIRQQQVAKVAAARDTLWEKELHAAHQGWENTVRAYDQAHADLGHARTELAQTRELAQQLHVDLASVLGRLDHTERLLNTVLDSRSLSAGLALLAPLRWVRRWVSRLTGRPVAPEVDPRVALRPDPESPVFLAPVRWHQGILERVTLAQAIEPSQQAAAVSDTLAAHVPPGPPPAPRYSVVDLSLVPGHAAANVVPAPRVAVHLHLHYTELLDEMLQALDNLPTPFSLFVTCTQPVDALLPTIHARFPAAVVDQCANQGRDIGPFMSVLQRHALHEFDLVLKVHGKQSRNDPNYLKAIQRLFGPSIQGGDDWRRGLVSAIAGSPERVRAIYQAFEQHPQLGMVGAAQFICRAPDADTQAYAALCARLHVSDQVLFFAGTMFWIRGALLQPFVQAGLDLNSFTPESGDRPGARVEAMLEHQCERVFGAVVASQGAWLGGVAPLNPS